LIQTNSYAGQYTLNSVFNQSNTNFYSSLFNYQDGSAAILQTPYGYRARQRPNIKINQAIIGTGNIRNGSTDYPAPYGNWYWASKHQFLIQAAELQALGISSGNIDSIGFDVFWTDPNTQYDYFDVFIKQVNLQDIESIFQPVDTNNYLHSNFKISSSGENIYLYDQNQNLVHSLFVQVSDLDNSRGCLPDGSATILTFEKATPKASNNNSYASNVYLSSPSFSLNPGFYNQMQYVEILHSNPGNVSIYYTLDGSDPDTSSFLYIGNAIPIYFSSVLKAKIYSNDYTALPSINSAASYFIGVNHYTPVLSVVTDRNNLYGNQGIFDQWFMDWEKASYVEYYDTNQQLVFGQKAGMQIDGGWGGSRSHPQHSFRIELADPVLGAGSIQSPLIPNKSQRTTYSNLYLRNGSNQYLELPYKDAAQVEMMGCSTNIYYSAWRPITVYINGEYFGLYELREKFDEDFFHFMDGADSDSIDLLSQSAWNSGILRAVSGEVDSFNLSYFRYNNLNTSDTSFWEQADRLIDMKWYHDYIIAESWMGNKDWPGNNIKIYRSNASDWRWRFCLIDLELALAPNGWSDFTEDHIQYMLGQSSQNPYINIWLKGLQNTKFKRYFINRFADLMNTSYKYVSLNQISQRFFNESLLEMPRQLLRWGNGSSVNLQMNDFINNHQIFENQLSRRTDEVRNHIQNNFLLQSQVQVELEVSPPDAGKIKLNTIIPDSLPWSGIYFNGNPIEMQVIENPGYKFAYWEINNIILQRDTNKKIELNVFADALFNAVFVPDSTQGKLAISELNYNSDSTINAGDWIELLNYGNASLDISLYKITDGTANNEYFFPSGSIIAPRERLVLVSDSVKFSLQHPNCTYFSVLPFGFKNSGERIQIFDSFNQLQIEMNYLDSLPWPMVCDGHGRTLEILSDSLDPNLSESWFAGCMGGTPGLPYSNCTEPIVISEINYNSNPLKDAGDWIEIYNRGTQSIDISNWFFSDDDDLHRYYIPQGTVLSGQNYLVIYNDSSKFNGRFPLINSKTGPFSFGLSSAGEIVRLYNQNGILVHSLFYNDELPWPTEPDGNGFTLELIQPFLNPFWYSSWQKSCEEGSPSIAPQNPCGTSGLNELISIPIQVFPMPNRGEFILNWESDKELNWQEIKLYDLSGREVGLSVDIVNDNSMQLSLIEKRMGIYILKCRSDLGFFTAKISVITD